jgi:hypothetical protein
MPNQPLGLPEGSVRAIIALVSVAGLILAVILKVQDSYIAVLSGLASSASTYYFNSRGSRNEESKVS